MQWDHGFRILGSAGVMWKNIVESFNLKPMRRLENLVVAIVMLDKLVETREKFGKIGLDKCNV